MKNPPRSVMLILNPKSGKQQIYLSWLNKLFGWNNVNRGYATKEIIAIIKPIFESKGIAFNYAYTDYGGHAKELAQNAVNNDVDTVIAMGGDGTINEVVNGIVGSGVRLGVIPYGTANVFGISFDLPTQLEAACDKIVAGETSTIDIGSINGHYFVCMAGVGFDAYIIKKADKSLKKLIGGISYVFLAMVEYFRYRFHPIVFQVDDDPTPKRAYFLIICNTKYYGGKYVVSDKTDPSDGMLDICLIKDKGLLTAISCIFQLALGKLKGGKMVEKLQCKTIRIRAFGKHRVHCDAEFVGYVPVTVNIHPQAIKIIT